MQKSKTNGREWSWYMKLRVVFEPSVTATKNMIWDERRLIVWDVFHLLLQFIIL
jgi:hypothetical protein